MLLAFGFCALAQAKDKAPPEVELLKRTRELGRVAEGFEKQVGEVEKECDPEKKMTEAEAAQCDAKASELEVKYAMIQEEQRKLAAWSTGLKAREERRAGACLAEPKSRPSEKFDELCGNFLEQLHILTNENEACEPGTHTPLLSRKCLEEARCVHARALADTLEALDWNLPGYVAKKTLKKGLDREIQACGGVQTHGNCSYEFWLGAWKSVTLNVEGFSDLVKLTGKGAWWLYRKSALEFWLPMQKADSQSADAMHAAAAQAPGFWHRFDEDPTGVLLDMASGFTAMIDRAIRETFGCEKWSGEPFKSQCLKPMKDWECATCTQRIQVECGLMGYFGADLFFSYVFTGGLGTLATVQSALAKATPAALARLQLKMPRTARAAAATLKATVEMGAAMGWAGRSALNQVDELLKAIASTRLSRRVEVVLRRTLPRSGVGRAATQAIRSKAFRGVVKTATAPFWIATYPARLFLAAGDAAGELGIRAAERLRMPLLLKALTYEERTLHYVQISAFDPYLRKIQKFEVDQVVEVPGMKLTPLPGVFRLETSDEVVYYSVASDGRGLKIEGVYPRTTFDELNVVGD